MNQIAEILKRGLAPAAVAICLWIGWSELKLDSMVASNPHQTRYGFKTHFDSLTKEWEFQDFSSHWNFCRVAWAHQDLRPYTAEGQQQIVEEWTRDHPPSALAFGYSPVLLLVLRPLLFLSDRQAYTFYLLLNATLLFFFIRNVLLRSCCNSLEQILFYFIWIFSAAFLDTVHLGQTALLSTMLLAICWFMIYDPRQQTWKSLRAGEKVFLGAAFFLLLAKPNVAAVLACILIASQCWSSLALGTVLFALAGLITLSHWGDWPNGPRDYFHFLSHYNQEQIGSFLSWSLTPLNNTNLASALTQFHLASAPLASRISTLAGFALGSVFLIQLYIRRITPEVFFERIIFVFLLFSPNLMHTEDLLLGLLLLNRSLARKGMEKFVILGLFFAVLNFNQLYGIGAHSVLAQYPIPFFGKFFLFLLLFSKIKFFEPPIEYQNKT